MAVITVLFGSERVGEYRVTHVPFVIGRDASCDVTIENVGISREHCRVLYDGRRFYIEDMDSANGIFVEGHKTRKTSISNGDEIGLGKYSLVFRHSPRDITPEPILDEQPSSPFAEGEKSRTSDPMMTFKMDARAIQEQISAPKDRPSGPQRASEVARTFGGAAAASAGSTPFIPAGTKVQTFRGGRPRRSFLGCLARLLVVAFLLAVIGLATFLALTSFGIVSL